MSRGPAKPASPPAPEDLKELARLYGVELAYQDVGGQRREASSESLVRVLRVLGAEVDGAADVAGALRRRREELWRRRIEPVTIAWDDGPASAIVRLPEAESGRTLRAVIHREDGSALSLDWEARKAPDARKASVEGVAFVERRFPLPDRLPIGYHRLVLEAGGTVSESLVIASPRRAYTPEDGAASRSWGVFLPLYALRSETSWGAGDFADLRRLLGWVRDRGGGVVAILPLQAAFLDRPFEPSPYSPASRLFWNEFYLDVAAIPELAGCASARAILDAADFAREVEDLRRLPLVDYRRQMALKRRVLSELSRWFFREPTARRGAFDRYVAAHPRADDYARFRAAVEKAGAPWPDWPAAARDGTLAGGDFDEDARRYHLFVQWLADEQVADLSAAAREAGPGLYLDLPLGVNGQGYDVWRERPSFAVEASGGCPPDLVFPKGQDWGFPPLHPEGIRADGYRYVRDYVRHQMKSAGVLRIDHMPVFHRLFWVPRGLEPRDGAYVRYPAEELYALFNLESHRGRTVLVGEDLGTVPPEVPEAMARHDVHRMYVVQYALQPDREAALPEPPAASAASVNTHDMPPFAAFLRGADIDERARLGLMGGQDPAAEKETRRDLVEALRAFLEAAGASIDAGDEASLLRACLAHLAASPARLVLANLEDLWLETESQNIPSTSGENPNWRRKAALAFEEFRDQPDVLDLLAAVSRARTDGAQRPSRSR